MWGCSASDRGEASGHAAVLLAALAGWLVEEVYKSVYFARFDVWDPLQNSATRAAVFDQAALHRQWSSSMWDWALFTASWSFL